MTKEELLALTPSELVKVAARADDAWFDNVRPMFSDQIQMYDAGFRSLYAFHGDPASLVELFSKEPPVVHFVCYIQLARSEKGLTDFVKYVHKLTIQHVLSALGVNPPYDPSQKDVLR